MKPKPIYPFLLLAALLLPEAAGAQCAMCRAVLESNGDASVAEGINNGIVYLMAIPYILVGALIFLVYRKVRS
ncbi:hypothetical protein [Robiginitalea sp. SC105]|uniref:hypothetical protein n=1 Tax=Robiginitalea sp. SC105 TaxID=2762332 RepID=UPI00163977B8|nr:hypothetical protein [Robiginitalea sp. SC105]